MPDQLANGTHVTLTTTLPGIPTGTHGTVHGSWATHTGVIFDTNPAYIRYVPPTVLRIDHPDSIDDVELTTPERISFYAIAHHHDDEYNTCNNPDGCGRDALWWWDCTCGHTRYGCHPCRTAYDHHNTGETRLCANCHTPIPQTLPWRAL